jgi:hypothetical protein
LFCLQSSRPKCNQHTNPASGCQLLLLLLRLGTNRTNAPSLVLINDCLSPSSVSLPSKRVRRSSPLPLLIRGHIYISGPITRLSRPISSLFVGFICVQRRIRLTASSTGDHRLLPLRLHYHHLFLMPPVAASSVHLDPFTSRTSFIAYDFFALLFYARSLINLGN